MNNTLETRLGLFFAFVLIAAVVIMEMIGGGWDFVWIDLQHGTIGPEHIMDIIRARLTRDPTPQVDMSGIELSSIATHSCSPAPGWHQASTRIRRLLARVKLRRASAGAARCGSRS